MAARRWRVWEVIGLLWTLAAGNLLHFVYDWSGQSPIVGAFAAVNESTWEHMKLLAMPWILFALLQRLVLGRAGESVLMAKLLGLLAGLLLIPGAYYTYRGITGADVMLVDVAIFQAAVLLAFWISWRLQERRRFSGRGWQIFALLCLLGIGALFIWWTYQPPQLPVFLSPLTGEAGIAG